MQSILSQPDEEMDQSSESDSNEKENDENLLISDLRLLKKKHLFKRYTPFEVLNILNLLGA